MAVRQQANEPVRGSVMADDGALSSLAATGLNERNNDAVFRRNRRRKKPWNEGKWNG